MGDRPFIVVSGLPASGKTTLAARLAVLLGLPLLDKDDILEALFAHAGEVDVACRQRLSRMSDAVLARIAAASRGAVIVSFWRHGDGEGNAGTPVAWLRALDGILLEVHCACAPEIAEQRFRAQRRHPGHNDGARQAGLAAQFAALAQRGKLGIGPAIEVRTDVPVDADALAGEIRSRLEGGS